DEVVGAEESVLLGEIAYHARKLRGRNALGLARFQARCVPCWRRASTPDPEASDDEDQPDPWGGNSSATHSTKCCLMPPGVVNRTARATLAAQSWWSQQASPGN